jgi:hypothetical protein
MTKPTADDLAILDKELALITGRASLQRIRHRNELKEYLLIEPYERN